MSPLRTNVRSPEPPRVSPVLTHVRRPAPSRRAARVRAVLVVVAAGLLGLPPPTASPTAGTSATVGADEQRFQQVGDVQRASPTAVYADVCDDAGGSPLDLRWTEIRPNGDAIRFTASSCGAWADAELDGRRLRWELNAAGGIAAVTVTGTDGALTVTASRVVDGAEVVTYTGPASRASVFAPQQGVHGEVPATALGSPPSFEFVLTLRHDTVTVDWLPETPAGEPSLTYPEPCPKQATRAVVTALPGRYTDARAAALTAGLDVVGEIRPIGAFEVEGPAAARLDALQRLPGVAAAERPVQASRLAVKPSDPAYPDQWALPEVNAARAWHFRTGSGLPVAVIDDGVDAARADLAGRVGAGRDSRFGRALPAGASSDRGGHGTAVASVLAAEGNNALDLAGVDWTATILPYRVFDAAGCASDVHVADAIVQAANAGVAAINLSVGTVEDTQVLRNAVDHADGQGTVLIAAVGNRQTANEAVYPAAYPQVIGVGATLRGGQIAEHSKTGPHVHVVAPGGRGSRQPDEDLLALGERYTIVARAGTSFSTPIVAGGVLLYRAIHPGAAPATVSAALARTAVDLGPDGYDHSYGHGMIDLHRLLLQAGIDRVCPPGKVPPAGFSDVPADSVHAPAIDCLVWWDIARGVGASRYGPGRNVSHAQMATFIAKTMEGGTGRSLPVSKDHFPDDNGNTHEPNINKLAEAGIVQGRDGRYWPGEPVSRAQMATFLANAYEHIAGRALPTDKSPFADVAGNTHEASIDKAFAAGLLRGRSASVYDPDASVRRDQMASFVVTLLGAFARDGHAKPHG